MQGEVLDNIQENFVFLVDNARWSPGNSLDQLAETTTTAILVLVGCNVGGAGGAGNGISQGAFVCGLQQGLQGATAGTQRDPGIGHFIQQFQHGDKILPQAFCCNRHAHKLSHNLPNQSNN